MKGEVYFIQALVGGPIKIGWSTIPEARLLDLQSGSPFKLKILCGVQGTRTDERRHHQRFSVANVGGEWFAPSPELIAYVESLGGRVFAARAWVAEDGGPQRVAPRSTERTAFKRELVDAQEYAADRLRKECAARGQAAKIARAIGFSKPSLSEIVQGTRHPGVSMLHALAGYWQLSFDELLDLASKAVTAAA